jgi:hypothetical protein
MGKKKGGGRFLLGLNAGVSTPDKQMKKQNWKRAGWYALFSLFLLGLVACGRFGNTGDSGVSGTIKVGQGKFLGKQATRMVVAVYARKDFDTTRNIPLASATPLAKTEINLTSPPYTFSVSTTGIVAEAYVFAFVDQDNSGGDKPNSGDLYGVYRDAVFLNGYALDSIDIDLTGYYGLPDIEVQVKMLDGAKPGPKANQLRFGFYKASDIAGNGLPKQGALPVVFYNVVDLKGQSSWTFRISPSQSSEPVIPVAWLNQSGSVGNIAAGDLYTTWTKGGISLEQPYKEKVLLLLDKTYAAAP